MISEVASDGEDISSGTDEPYATLIAKQHGYPHHIVRMTAAELVAAMLPFCVRVLECFDGMQLRNSMVVAAALHEAKELGCTQVLYRCQCMSETQLRHVFASVFPFEVASCSLRSGQRTTHDN